MEAEGVPRSVGYTTALNMQPLFQSQEFRRRTGAMIDYDLMEFKNTETACSKEGMWLTQDMLLAEKEDMDDIADAIIKVYVNTDELI